MLLIEHDVKLVMGLCDRVAVLDRKKIAEDRPAEVQRNPRRHHRLSGRSRCAPRISPTLELRDLESRYGAIEAVKGVSPQVSAGELVSLIGANGAGKTSTLNAIAGSVKASTGEIRFNGEIVNALPAHRRLRRGVALVPEGRGIFSRLTVHENLQMGAYIRNDTDGIAQDLQRVYALLPRIRERLDQVAGTSSPAASSRWSRSAAPCSRARNPCCSTSLRWAWRRSSSRRFSRSSTPWRRREWRSSWSSRMPIWPWRRASEPTSWRQERSR